MHEDLDEDLFDDEAEAMLARLAKLDMAAAERVHARLMTAEQTEALSDLGRTYQRLSRTVRQTLALRARLRRDEAREARLAEVELIRAAAAREGAAPDDLDDHRNAILADRRGHQLSLAVTRVAWDETEHLDAFEPLMDEVGEAVLERLVRRGFRNERLDDQVVEICKAVGLSEAGARNWRSLPKPAYDDLAYRPKSTGPTETPRSPDSS